jgi:hypothetical protein
MRKKGISVTRSNHMLFELKEYTSVSAQSVLNHWPLLLPTVSPARGESRTGCEYLTPQQAWQRSSGQ